MKETQVISTKTIDIGEGKQTRVTITIDLNMFELAESSRVAVFKMVDAIRAATEECERELGLAQPEP